MPRDRKNEHVYRAKRKRLLVKAKAQGICCHICGKPFDWSITNHLDPGYFTADHINSLQSGGHVLGELLPAHRGCNSRQGALEQARRTKQPEPPMQLHQSSWPL